MTGGGVSLLPLPWMNGLIIGMLRIDATITPMMIINNILMALPRAIPIDAVLRHVNFYAKS